MIKKLVPIVIGLCAMTLLSGCIGLAFSFGGGKKDSTSTTSNSTNSSNTASNSTANNSQNPGVVQQMVAPTIGQQLLDLKKARDAGVINEQEYQAEKAKLLSQK